MKRHPLLIAAAAAFVVVIADQVSKHWILVLFPAGFDYRQETWFFNLVLVKNCGISFGVGNNCGPFNALIFTALAALIVAGLVRWLWRVGGWLLPLAIGMVIGGAVGNVLDRVTLGWVVDFLDFHVEEWHFFAFNVADAGISVGVALMVIESLLGRRGAPK